MPSLCPYRTSDKGKTCFVRRRGGGGAAFGIAISEAGRNEAIGGARRKEGRNARFTSQISFQKEGSRDLSAAVHPLEEKNLNYVMFRG